MKKFMIFLLMAFLYLGTCQARSEATHFNNANVKLHSWVMPATSHAFIMDSKSVYGEPIVKVSPSQPQNLCLTCPLNKATFAVSFEENGSGESEASRVWLVNGHPTDSTGTTFTFSGYAAGHYTVACRVTTDAGYTYTSNYVEITVDVDAIVNIVGPDQACLNDVVTLTAQVENSSLECSYQWRRDGQYIVGATNPSYSFLVSELPGLTDTLVYEFDVQITRAGCDSKYSPVHYFMVAPTPVPQVDVPLFCTGSPVTLTGNAYTAGSIQPYMWKWINTTTNDTTVTYVNTVTIANPTSGDVYKVIPIYQDYACNADTAEVTLVSYQDSLHITELQDLTLIATPDTVCLDGMAQLKVNDPNKTNAALGEVSYTWYMNGTPVSGVTDSIYTATLSNTGTYTFKAVASYANYPCATAEDTVEVVVDTVPASVVITGNNILCQSGDAAYNSTTLTAEVTPSTGTYQYKWTGDTDFGTQITREISLPGVYAVIVKTAGGCETMSLPIQVYGFGADVQITSTQTTCAGQPVTLNVNADGWTSNVTYQWDNGQTTSTINVTPTVDTWYKVTSTAHLTDGTTCTRTDSIQVLVLSAPTAPEVATKDNTICQDSLVTIYVKNAVDGTHYTWYQNGIELPGFNLDTISVELNTPGTYTFAAAVVSPNGCVSPASTAVTITVEAAPTLLTITGTDVICEGSQATLTAHAEGVAATDPYIWSTGDKTNEIQVGAGTYAVTAYSDNGCAVSAEYTVHSLGSDVQLTASTTEVCAGQSVTLNVNVDGWGEGNISYEWAGVTNGAHSNHVTVTPTESGYYKVTTTVTSTAGTCSRVDSIYITVIEVSVSDVAFIGPDTICVGSQATMTAVSNGANYFVWYENGVQISGENLDTIRDMPTEPGSYIYSVAAVSNGCVSKDTTLQPELLVLGNPTVEITGDPIICNDSTIHLIAIINDTLNTNANGASYTYEWRLYNNTLTNGSNTVDGVDYDFVINADTLETEVHSQDHPYIFTVTAYNENGCAATSEPYNVYVGNDIEVAVTVDRDTVCKGGMVTATAHLGDYNMSNLVYNWYIVTEAAGYTDTTWIADATSITYTASVEENLKIGVKVTQTTTGCTIMGDTTVTVFNPEIISVIVSNETFNDGSDFTVCEGEEVYVTAYIEDETTGAKIIDSSLIYVWYENGILLQGVDGPTFHKQLSILDEDTANYVYSVFIDFGVEGCLPKPVASNKVHVNRNPIVTIAGHHNVCYFGPYEETGYHNVHLIAWVNGDYNPDFTYTWYEHGQERYSVAGSIYDNHYTETWIPTFDNPHVFTVMVSDSNGCTTLSEPFEVNVYNKPVVNITASETTICDGGQSILTAHLDNYNDPNLIYQWYTNTTEPDNMIPGMTELTETFMPEDTTTYIIKVTHLLENGTLNAQACFSLATMTINVNDDPVIDSVTSDLAEGNDTICEGRYVTFTAHISGGVAGGEIFTWYRNGEIIPGAVDSVYRETPQAVNGDITVYDYAVSVRQTASGCESNVTPADTITVYPNPVLVLVTDPIVCDTLENNIVMYANVTPAPTSSYNFTWYEDNAEITDGTLSGTHNDTIKITRPYRDYEYSFAVELVNDYGCTVRDEATVHVNDNPIVHATVTEDSICVGGQITLTANLDDYNADMLEFHWYDNGQLIGTATELTYTTVPTFGPHKYNMTALQRNSLCIASSDTVVVNVMADPIIDSVTTDLAEGNDTICEGRFVTLTAHISGGVTGGEIFTWYRNGEIIPGAVDSVYQETPQAENGDPTTYDYTVTVRQTANGCESNANGYNTITVLPNPVLELVTDPIVCDTLENNIVMYANVTPAPTSSYSFTWYEDNQVLADGTMMGEHNDSIKLTRPYRDYPYSFSVELVNDYGCTTRDDATIYVNDNPIVHATVTEDSICVGGQITLTANLDDYNADMLEFHWYDNGQLIGTATELTYTTVPTFGPHKYNMTALQRNSLCIASSDTVVVNVMADPIIDSVTTDLAEGNDTICEGRFVTLTAHISGGVTGGEIFTWYRNGEIIPGAVDSVYQETPQAENGDPTTYDYTVTVRQTANGCESNANGYNTITVLPNPVLELVTDPIVCDTLENNIVMYANVTPAPTSSYSFTWYEDNQVLADGTMMGEHNDSIKLTRPYRDYPYSFSVELVNAYGCTVRDDATIYVNDNPIVHATVTDDTLCIGGEITLTANLDDYNADMLEFHWYDNGQLIGTATELTYTTVPTIGEHRYNMTALQRNSLCIASSDTVVVLVKPDPVISQVVLSDYIACEGAQVRVEAIADSTTYTPSATDVYTWYRNGIRIPGATNRVLFDTPVTVDQNTQQFVYTAVVTLEEPGCTSLPVSASALTIYRNPVVAISGDQHVCETDYTFLIANVDTVGMNVGNLHYTWFINGDIRDNNAYNLGDNRFFAEYLYPRDEPYIFTVTVERGDIANACASTSAPYEVYVYPKPEVNITGNVTDICENGTVTLQANLNDYNADNMTFQWYEVRNVTSVIAIDYLPGGGYVYDTIVTQYNYNIPGATGFRYTTTLAETTTLGVIVTQTTSQCYDIDEFTVTVHPTPAAPIIAVDHEMICSAGDVTFTVTNDYSEYGTPIYAWMVNGHVIPGTYGPVYHQEPGLVAGTTHHYNAIVAFDMPGCISVVSDTADVVVIPDPVVTVTVDGPTTICEGGSVTFSANAQPTTLDYTYQWYDYNNQLMVGDTNPTLTVSPSANQQNYQYLVVVNSLPGCQIVADAPVVTVVTDPVVTLSIDNPIICQGGQSTLTVDVQGGIAGQNGIDPYSYAWYSNNNTETPFAVTSTPIYVLPTNLETDSFAYWVEVSANTYGCATTSAHVNQLVVADPIVNIIVAPTYPETVCDGGNTMLVATVQGGFGENSYQWYRNQTILVGETNPTLNTGILSVNDINSYRVIVTQTGSGCETVSDTFQVPVIPTYDVVVSALNNATVCEGGTTTMEATITNTILPNDNPTFQWYEIIDGANVAIAGANSTRYTTSPLLTDGNHTYFVAVTSQITGSGCSSHSNSFYTSIVDDPVVTVTTTAINNVVCEGDVVHVNATVAPAGGNYTYNWTWTNGTNTYTYTNNEPTFAPTDLPASINGYLFNVSIVSTDANSGCNATSNNNAYVTVMPRPVVTITADNEVVCAGGHVVLTANHNASDYTGFNYAWTINGTNMASTLQTITVPASMVTTGTINASVIVTSSQLTLNCSSSATLSQPVQVLAQPTIALSADHLTMCAGAAPTLTATVNGNSINTPMTFVWKRNGSIINGATGSVYQSEPLNAGTYNFQVMALSENTDLNCNSDWSADNAVVVRVAETPVVSIASADGTLDLCEGGNITLTATVINANNTIGDFTNGSIYGAYNYVWNRDNNVVATNNNITLPQNQITETLNTYGYYTYNVNLTPVGALAFGCGSVMAENPVVVNVHLRPNWDAAVVSAHDGNICLGEEVQLHAHITGGVADMNGNTNGHIQWVVEFNGVASNVSNYGGDATHTPTVPGVYTYYPTYVAYEGSIIGSGCAFTSSNDQVSTFVTVHALPTAAFVSGDGSIICANVSDDNAALTIHFTGTPPFHFTVDDLSNGTSVMYDSYTNDYVIYVNPNHTTQYRITYLSDNYCSNGELGLDAIATIFVNDIQFEETFFQAECGEDVVTISFNMLSGTPNSDFTVTYDNGMVVNGTISNNTATFATPSIPGDYHAVFTVGGCDYDIIVRRPVGVDDFSDGSTPFMMQRWDDVVIINNNPATNGGHTFVSYQWYRNGVAIPGAIYKNYQEIGGLNGYYSIEVVSQDADGRTVTYRTCDQFFSSSSAIRVYPVPANVQQVVTVEIDMTAEELEGATLDIYDVTGSLVEHVTTVDPVTYLSGFKASGTYFGRLMMANGETKTVKFVIVK